MATKTQVMKRTGMRESQIQFYTKQRVVIPQSGGGRGQPFNYSPKNIFEFGIINRLFEYKMSVQQIDFIIRQLNNRRFFKALFNDKGEFNRPVKFLGWVPYIAIYDSGESVEFGTIGKSDFENPLGVKMMPSLNKHYTVLIVRIDQELKAAGLDLSKELDGDNTPPELDLSRR